MKGIRKCFIGLLAVISCSQPGRSGGAREGGPNLLCGNGIVEPDNEETCDLGALNGAPGGTCSRQCSEWPGGSVVAMEPHLPLGESPTRAVTVLPTWGHGIAFTSFDRSGIHVAPNIRYGEFVPADQLGNPPQQIELRVAADPVALGNVFVRDDNELLPIWIEQAPGDPIAHMYFAELAADYTASVHEIPYPFPDGTKPELVVSDWRRSVMIVDQSGTPPYDLLVAVLAVRSASDWTTTTLRVAAPGRTRGAAVEATADEDPANPSIMTQRVVQFFDDTHAFIALEDLEPVDGSFGSSPYQLYESARGSWPFRVVGGDIWVEGCDDHGAYPTQLPASLTHPYPLAVLTDSGDIFMWQFDHSPDGENLPSPFAHVPAGAGALHTWDDNYSVLVHVLAPDGIMYELKDADCQDLQSGALAPLLVTATTPWSVVAPVLYRGFSYGGTISDGWYMQHP